MADEQDDSQKTEEPTQKRLDDARQKGQVANSREINHWFMIAAGTLFVTGFAPRALTDIQALLVPFIERPEVIATDPGELRGLILSLFTQLLQVTAVPLALAVTAAITAGFIQQGFL